MCNLHYGAVNNLAHAFAYAHPWFCSQLLSATPAVIYTGGIKVMGRRTANEARLIH